MTAATLHVVPEPMPAGDTKDQYAWILKKKAQAKEAADWAYSLPRRLWDWAWEFFNMDTVVSTLSTVGSFLKQQALGLGSIIGSVGGIGLGLLSVTTDLGRSVLSNTVGRVLGWAGGLLSWGWNTLYSGVTRLGPIGQWVGDRMIQIEKGAKIAAANVLTFYVKHVARHLDINGPVMKTGRAVGVWAVVIRALSFITPLPLRMLVIGATAMWTLVESPLAQVPGFKVAAEFLKGDDPKPAELKAVDKEYSEAVTAAAVATATTGKVSPPPANRAAQRAAERRNKGRSNATPANA